MAKKSCTSSALTLAGLLADPSVQLVLRADHATEEQLRPLIGAPLNGPRAGSEPALARNQCQGTPVTSAGHPRGICGTLPSWRRGRRQLQLATS
jgi:hypothetical protein